MGKKRSIWQRLLAFVILFCLVVAPHLPSKVAKATDNIIAPSYCGRISNRGYYLSYSDYRNGNLKLRNTYNYVAGELMTYYTTDVIWSKNRTGENGIPMGYPTLSGTQGVDWVYSGVSALNERVRDGDTESYSGYDYSQRKIEGMLTTLFGELQPNRTYTIYMSEIFILRKRHADGSFTDYPGTKYDNIDDIRKASTWTQKTYDQFVAYYDIPMKFWMKGGIIEVIPVDMDNGNTPIPGASYAKEYFAASNVLVEPVPSYVVGDKTYGYAGRYNYSESGKCTLSELGYPKEIFMAFAHDRGKLYLGYSSSVSPPTPTPNPAGGDKRGTVKVVPVDMDNGKKEIPGASFTMEYGDGIELTIPVETSYTVGGEILAYSGKWSVNKKSLDNSVNPVKPHFGEVNNNNTVYLGYKRGIPIPSPAPVEGTGTIKVVPVDMDNGNTPIEGAKKVITYLAWGNVNLDNYIDPTCTKGGETLAYAEKYNFTESGSVSLSQSGYPGVRCMGDVNDRTTLYIGYKRGIAPPVPSITPSISPTPAPIVTMPPLPTLPPATPTPTPGPNEEVAEIWAPGQKVQIYADDYNSSTGPYDDKQPYLVEDISDGVISSQGSIPSTEDVVIRATAKGWSYDIKMKKTTGSIVVEQPVVVKYNYKYYYTVWVDNPDYPELTDPDYDSYDFNDEGEPLDDDGNVIPKRITEIREAIGESSFSYGIATTRYYSYWEVASADTYLADKFEVTNGAFSSMVTIPVDWSAPGAPTVPYPMVSSSHEMRVPAITTITHANVVDCTGVSDSAERYRMCEEIALHYYHDAAPQLIVRSDSLSIDGVALLSGDSKVRDAYGPITANYDVVKGRIKDISFNQAYKSGIDLVDTKYNSTYSSLARVTYKTSSGKTKVADQSEMQVNSIKVHTPVVCDGIITVDGVESGRHDSGDFAYGTMVDFPLKDLYNPFTIEISNYGTHKLLVGYGERDFEYAKKSGVKNVADASGMSYNEVIFPFGVYYDKNGDSFDPDGNMVSFTDDKYFEPNTPIRIGSSAQQFYVMGSMTPGTYDIKYRSVAVNCPKNPDGTYNIASYSQKNANTNSTKYATTDSIRLNVYEDFMDFRLNGTNDPEAFRDYLGGQRMLTLDKGYYFNFYALTIGDRFNSDSMKVTFKPTYTFISSNGKTRVDADLYYHENIKGKSEYYVEVGGAKDATNIHTYTNRDELPGIDSSALRYTETVLGRKIAGNKTDMFTFGGEILSDQWFRMYAGNINPVPNMYCSQCYTVYYEAFAAPCGHAATHQVRIFTVSSIDSLVQEWYAGFYLPADTYCVTADTKQGYCDTCGKVRYVTEGRTSCPDHGTALKVAAGGAVGVAGFNFNAYAAEHTLTGEEEFFRKDGYVAITFAIEANDAVGSFHRVYEDYDTTEIAKQWMASGFPYQTGDVILYRLDKSIRDAYEIGGSE